MKLLLIDPGWDHTPYLVRELARAGFQVTLATPFPPDRRLLGRFCTQVPAPWSASDPAPFKKLIEDNPADFVMPLSEDIMETLWRDQSLLSGRLFPATSDLQRRLLGDRTQMYEFARSLGVPTPRMSELSGPSDLEEAFRSFGSPLVLRGTQGLAGLQVMIVKDLSEALGAYGQLVERSPGAPFAQEFIGGRRCLVGGLFHEGAALQLFAQTTVEAVRPPTGPSIRVRSLNDPRLLDHTRTLFRGFGWSGLACAEYMLGEDGGYRFLEINPRPWAAIYASHCCGVPLLESFARYLGGDLAERPSLIPDGKEVVLFPQFLSTRISAGEFPRLGDVSYYLAALRAAPWNSPALLMHMLRRAFWSRKA